MIYRGRYDRQRNAVGTAPGGHLTGALERLRATFRWKTDDLDAAGLNTRIGASALTLGSLLKHLARAEDEMFTAKLSGAPVSPPWDTVDWRADPEWDFTSAAADTPAQLYRLWDTTVDRSRAKLHAALADGGLDQLVHLHWPDGRHLSLRRLICDLIEEYGRHTGHADLLREAVDGRVGEDPHPAGAPTPNRDSRSGSYQRGKSDISPRWRLPDPGCQWRSAKSRSSGPVWSGSSSIGLWPQSRDSIRTAGTWR